MGLIRIACASAATAFLVMAGTAFAAEGDISFRSCVKDAGAASTCSDRAGTIDGLNSASGITASPDGEFVYVTGAEALEDAVTVFARHPSSGALFPIDRERDGVGGADGLDGASDVVVSPDSKHVYVAGADEHSLSAFATNPATGELSFIEVEKDGVAGVDGLMQVFRIAMSPDGKHVYAAGAFDAALAVFARDPATGQLSFVEVVRDGVGGVDGLFGVLDVTTSPDGAHVYAASPFEDSVAAFTRDPATGALSFVGVVTDGAGGVDGLDGAGNVMASPDGRNIYVTGREDDSVAAFTREPGSGALSFIEAEKDGVGGVEGLDGAQGVTTSTDGKHLYIAGYLDDSLAAFARHPATGALSFQQYATDGLGGVDGLDGATGVTTTPDGKHVYATGYLDDSVAGFARDPDVTAPSVQIDSGPAGQTPDATATFAFSSPDPFGTRFECQVDSAGFGPCSGAGTHTTGNLGSGTHTFAVRAIDTAANVGQPMTRGFTVLAPSSPPSAPPRPALPSPAQPPARALTLTVRAKRQQELEKLTVRATCSLDCTLSLRAKGRAGERFRSKTLERQLEARRPTKLRLTVPASKLRRIRDRAGKATVTVTAAAGANELSQKLRVRLKGK